MRDSYHRDTNRIFTTFLRSDNHVLNAHRKKFKAIFWSIGADLRGLSKSARRPTNDRNLWGGRRKRKIAVMSKSISFGAAGVASIALATMAYAGTSRFIRSAPEAEVKIALKESRSILESNSTSRISRFGGGGDGGDSPAEMPSNQTAHQRWAARLMQDVVSPVQATAKDLVESWTDTQGTTNKIVVKVPDVDGKATINLESPGSGVDARPLIQQAIAQLEEQGGGTLKLGSGVFSLRSANTNGAPGVAHILIRRMHDIDIVGNNTTLKFEKHLDGIMIGDSERIRIKGIKMRYAGQQAAEAVVERMGDQSVLRFTQDLPMGSSVYWVQEYDAASKTWPSGGKRIITPPGFNPAPVQLNSRTFASSYYNTFADGQEVTAKLDWYSPRAVYVRDSNKGVTNDVVLDDVDIGSVGGIAVLIYSRGRGFAMVNSRLSKTGTSPYSANYDGFHVMSAAGDVLVRGNTLMHTGDDIINIRSQSHEVAEVRSETQVTLTRVTRLIREGDEIAFFDENGDYMASRFALGVDPVSSEKANLELSPGESIAGAALARAINFSTSRFAVVGNDISYTSGKGVVAQVPNGLIKGNRFNHVKMDSIRLRTALFSWYEGAGAINIRVSGNHFGETGRGASTSYESGIVTSLSERIQGKLSTSDHNGPLKFDNNVFTMADSPCIRIYNTIQVTMSMNTCPSEDGNSGDSDSDSGSGAPAEKPAPSRRFFR